MHTDSEPNVGGDKIIPYPSARPGIHSYRPCVDEQEMGRYGYNNRKTPECTKPRPQQDEGTDEVDNVMSKFKIPHSSPRMVNNLQRSNSFRSPQQHQNNDEDDDDDDDDSLEDDELAKSLPTYLPSHNSRDDYNEWQIQTEHQTSKHSNNSSILSTKYMTPVTERNNLSRNHENITIYTRSPSKTPSRSHQNQRKVQEKGRSLTQNLSIVAIVVCVLAIIIAFYYGRIDSFTGTNNVRYSQLNFYKDVKSLRGKYQINNDAVLQVQSGISTIFDKEDAGSFVFIYNSETTHFDPLKFNNFMNDIASTAARYLRNDSTSVRHLVVDSSELDMQSHSDLIEKYRDDVTRGGVMLVKDLNDVPPSLAMAFHYYCDEYNPLVKKSAIFFTLNMAKCPNTADESKNHAYIEKCLAKRWNGGLPQDNIRPLLTRIVNIVVDVTGRI